MTAPAETSGAPGPEETAPDDAPAGALVAARRLKEKTGAPPLRGLV